MVEGLKYCIELAMRLDSVQAGSLCRVFHVLAFDAGRETNGRVDNKELTGNSTRLRVNTMSGIDLSLVHFRSN